MTASSGAASPTTAAADALVPAQHPFAGHLRYASEQSAHSLWTPEDGPLPSLYISHGAPPLFEDSGWMPRLPALQLIGDASYSLYLLQFFIINPVHKRLADWPAPLSTAAALIGCTLLGLVCYFLLERPLQLAASRLQNLTAAPFQRASDRRPA